MLIIMNVRGEVRVKYLWKKERKTKEKEERIEEEQELNLILNLKWVGFVKLDQIQLRRRLSFFASSHKSSYYFLSPSVFFLLCFLWADF